ncbi:MAG: glycosyltransferase family 2 protein [Ignavibacteria bacterium]
MVDLSIVIVSWNSRLDLMRCLGSLKTSHPSVAYEVVVVDNASSDETVAFLKQTYPDVHVIVNEHNRGFAAANNQAFGVVRGRYILLLNPDTLVHDGALDALVAFMDTHTDAGAAGPILCNKDGSLQYTGVRFPRVGDLLVESLFLDQIFPRSRIFGRHKETYADVHSVRSVDFVQGSCMIVRSDIVRSVGGLDENFFLYFEEVDWCKRMQDAGYRVYVVPWARITHLANVEIGHYNEHRVVHYHRSLLRLFQKHHGFVDRVLLRAVLALRSIIRILVWSVMALVRPSLRSKSISAMRGYVRTLGLLLRRKEPVHV